MDYILEYMKWQLILSIKRTLCDIKYRYDLNLNIIDNLKKDDLLQGIKNRQDDNEKLSDIFKETMITISRQFGMKSVKEIDNYLKNEFGKVVQIISSNINFYELNLDSYNNFLQSYKDNTEFKNLLEIFKQQKTYFKSIYTGFSDTIYKDLLYLINLDNYDLIEIYDEIVKKKYFNPNIGGCGTSNEKFWCSLPDVNCGLENIIELNRKIILDSRVNYHLISNGMIYINVFCEKTLRESKCSLNEKLYYFNLVADAIKLNKCSILDTKFIDGIKEKEDNNLIKNILLGDYQIELMGLVSDLKKYLLSNNGLNQQIINSRYPTIKRNESIDLYLSAINGEDNVSSELVKKLRSMKI